MKITFRATDGAPCWRCNRTAHHYTVDDAVTLIDVRCEHCYADNTFCPSKNIDAGNFLATVTKAHRESQT